MDYPALRDLLLLGKSWTSQSPVLSAGLLLGVIAVLPSVVASFKSSKYPPGPRPLPLLGNIFDFDARQPWPAFTKWKEIYGMYLPFDVHCTFFYSYLPVGDVI